MKSWQRSANILKEIEKQVDFTYPSILKIPLKKWKDSAKEQYL